jgi:hypothetical protein
MLLLPLLKLLLPLPQASDLSAQLSDHVVLGLRGRGRSSSCCGVVGAHDGREREERRELI